MAQGKFSDNFKRVGGVWIGTTQKGNKQLSVRIGDAKYVAYKNNKKEKENDPDFIIYQRKTNGSSNVSKPSGKVPPPSKPKEEQDDDLLW